MRRKGRKAKAKQKRAATVRGAEKGEDESELEALLVDQLQLLDVNVDADQIDSGNNAGDDTCKHGLVELPPGHVCNGFLNVFSRSLTETRNEIEALIVTQRTHPKVWQEAEKMDYVLSYFSSLGTQALLDDVVNAAKSYAFTISSIEAHLAIHLHKKLGVKTDKTVELVRADKRILISFFKKRIPCRCVDEEYEQIKSLPKIGFCRNEESCPMPNGAVEKSKMLTCSRCLNVHYCSRKCQKAHWRQHQRVCSALQSICKE